MKVARLSWIAAVVLILLWSGLSAGLYALLGAGSGWLEGNTEWFAAYPEARAWIEWGLSMVSGISGVLLATIWALGTLSIVVVAWVGNLAWRKANALVRE